MKTSLATLKGRLFRLFCRLGGKDVSVGEGLKLYCCLSISGPGKVIIGDHCTIRRVPGSQTQHVTLRTNSPEAVIRIGDHARLNAAKISCRFAITIGDHVIIEDASLMDTDFHTFDVTRKLPANESLDKCAINIGDHVGISSRSIVTKGVTLGDGCLVAPATLVQKSFPAGSVILGNPAAIIDDSCHRR